MSAICVNLDQSKILSSGNGVSLYLYNPECLYGGHLQILGWGGSVAVKCWTISPVVRGSIPDLVRTFLRHFVFAIQV